MQDLGYELPRIPIPRTWVHKGLLVCLLTLGNTATSKSPSKGCRETKHSLDRFAGAAGLAEAKEFERPFNTRRGGRLNENPRAQVLRYLKETRVGWGILANGWSPDRSRDSTRRM